MISVHFGAPGPHYCTDFGGNTWPSRARRPRPEPSRAGRRTASCCSPGCRTRRPRRGRGGSARPSRPNPGPGTRDATRFSPVSWQAAGALGGLLSGPAPHCDEDCLTPQRGDTGARRRRPTRDGVDPRRRLRRRQRIDALVRRHVVRSAAATSSSSPSTTGSARSASCTSARSVARRTRRRGCRASSTRRGAAVGARQHRRVRRRPGQRHHLRRVRRWHERGHAARPARGVRAVPPGHRPERRGPQPARPRRRASR